MLILQGGREYQVTVPDNLARWWDALAEPARGGDPDPRSGSTIRIHPGANHLFFTGRGRSTPAEYARSGHVDAEVVGEIATWLADGR
jgi:hypothetical protein